MTHRIQLKNSSQHAHLDHHVYQALLQDTRLNKLGVLDNLRLHSSGCVVFQKTQKCDNERGYRTITIYLHKLIAERYLGDTRSRERNLVGSLNGDKLDCRLANLEYRSRSAASRQRRSSSKLGYTGVYQENNRYRAVISVNRRSVHIGMFATAEEAALAYNKKSRELYGKQGKINKVMPAAPSDQRAGHLAFTDRAR